MKAAFRCDSERRTPTAGHDGVMLDYSACGRGGEPRVIHVDAESGDQQPLATDFEGFLNGLVDRGPYDEQTKMGMEEDRRRLGQ